MPERGDRLVVLFDRDCRFCGWVARQLSRIDRDRSLLLMPLQEAGNDASRPQLAATAREYPLDEALHVVAANGAISRGGDALIEIFRRLPGGALVALWSRLPGARGLADLAYRVAARNRAALGRLLLRTGANCELPRQRSKAPARATGPAATSSAGSDTSGHRSRGCEGGAA